MKDIVKRKFRKYFPGLEAIRLLVLRRDSYLRRTGWIESLKRGYPCNCDGFEIPWMNYSVIAILKERLNRELNLFEFGSGYSTMFYAALVREVISVEYDKDWLELLEKKVPDNVMLIHRTVEKDGLYCRAITEFDQEFDVVIIDGRDRVNCIRQAIGKLSERGVMILDDSFRERYIEAIEHAKKLGFRALGVEGIKPTGGRVERTTILYRTGNCLEI